MLQLPLLKAVGSSVESQGHSSTSSPYLFHPLHQSACRLESSHLWTMSQWGKQSVAPASWWLRRASQVWESRSGHSSVRILHTVHCLHYTSLYRRQNHYQLKSYLLFRFLCLPGLHKRRQLEEWCLPQQWIPDHGPLACPRLGFFLWFRRAGPFADGWGWQVGGRKWQVNVNYRVVYNSRCRAQGGGFHRPGHRHRSRGALEIHWVRNSRATKLELALSGRGVALSGRGEGTLRVWVRGNEIRSFQW